MTRNRDRSRDAPAPPTTYDPPDPLFRAYDRGQEQGLVDAASEFDDEDPPPPTGEALAERMALIEQLAADARKSVGRYARVDVGDSDGFPVLAVVPTNPRAAGIWVVGDHDLDVQIGDSTVRWSLPWSESSASLVRAMVRATIEGRVTQTDGFRRVAVTVEFDDGSMTGAEASTGILGLVRIPGWRRWGRTIAFVPYRS